MCPFIRITVVTSPLWLVTHIARDSKQPFITASTFCPSGYCSHDFGFILFYSIVLGIVSPCGHRLG